MFWLKDLNLICNFIVISYKKVTAIPVIYKDNDIICRGFGEKYYSICIL